MAMAKPKSSRSRANPVTTRVFHVDEDTLRTVVRSEIQDMVPGLLQDTLTRMGLNIVEPEDVIETQKDMAYLRSWRKAVQAGSGRAGLAMVSLAILGVVAAILAQIGIKLPSFAIPTQ